MCKASLSEPSRVGAITAISLCLGLAAALGDTQASPWPDGQYCIAVQERQPASYQPPGVLFFRGGALSGTSKVLITEPDSCSSPPRVTYELSSYPSFPISAGVVSFAPSKCNGRWVPQAVAGATQVSCSLPWNQQCDATSFEFEALSINNAGLLSVFELLHISGPNQFPPDGSLSIDDDWTYTLSLETGAWDGSDDWSYRELGSYCTTHTSIYKHGSGQHLMVDLTNPTGLPLFYCGPAVCPPPGLRLVDPAQLPSWPAYDFVNREQLRRDLAAAAGGVVGVSTDGTSRMLVVIESSNASQVKLTLCAGACPSSPAAADPALGGLIELPLDFSPFDPGSFANIGDTAATVTPSTLKGYPSDRFFAFALYTPPRQVPAGTIGGLVGLGLYEQNELRQESSFRLTWPPLLLVHGVFADDTTWSSFKDFLRGNYDAASVVLADYKLTNAESFDNDLTQVLFGAYLFEARLQARNAGIVADRVDVVAHSMGGLVARTYANRKAYGNDPDSFLQGEINRLTTVGTPHLGTNLLNWALEHRAASPDLLQLPCWLTQGQSLEQFLSSTGHPIGTAVEAMVVGSLQLGDLAPPSRLAFRSLRGIAPAKSPTRDKLDTFIGCYDSGVNTVDRLLGTPNDTIVGSESQGSGAALVVDVPGVVHEALSPEPSETDAEGIFARLNDLLHERSLAAPAAPVTQPATTAGSSQSPLIRRPRRSPSILRLASPQTSQSQLVAASPPDGATLAIFTPVAISASIPGQSVVRLLGLLDDQLTDLKSPPFSWTWTPAQPGTHELRLVASLADGSFGTATAHYNVVTPPAPIEITVDPESLTLKEPGATMSLLPRALFANGSIDIRSLAAYAIPPGERSIVKISADGLITATDFGETEIVVSYVGLSRAVPVQVGLPTSRGFFTLAPCRVVDTRLAAGPYGGPALSAGTVRVIGLTGICGIPATAIAVAVNITVTQGSAQGELALYPADQLPPLPSIISFRAGMTRANNAVLGLARDGSGQVSAALTGAETVHVILDVTGYFN
jgi:pimeloyl-ACP methyl ester carboxylesterase